jgi:hypothetical protein
MPAVPKWVRVSAMCRSCAGSGDDVFDQTAREAEPVVLVHPTAAFQRDLAKRWERPAHADGLEHVERALVDALDVAVAQRPVGATDETRSHRRVLRPRRPLREARGPAAPPTARGCAIARGLLRHVAPPMKAADLAYLPTLGFTTSRALAELRNEQDRSGLVTGPPSPRIQRALTN